MIRPDRKILQAIASLEGNPDFETIRQWVVNSYMEQLKALPRVIANIEIGQGRARELEELVEAMNDARSTLSRMK